MNLDRMNSLSLSDKMALVDQIEDWCKAVRAEVAAKLHSGEPVPGWKLVKGKMGNRQWVTDAEKELVKHIDENLLFERVLTSPTQLEKKLRSCPPAWEKAREFITQKEGAPHVAPESDPRPALVVAPLSDDFENLDDLV